MGGKSNFNQTKSTQIEILMKKLEKCINIQAINFHKVSHHHHNGLVGVRMHVMVRKHHLLTKLAIIYSFSVLAAQIIPKLPSPYYISP